MATDLERRMDALESRLKYNRAAAEMTDHELLAIIAPDHTGPMPSDDELLAMMRACLENNRPTGRVNHGKY